MSLAEPLTRAGERFTRDLQVCTSWGQVGHALRRFAKAEIGCSGFNFVPLDPRPHLAADLLVSSDEHPDDVILRNFVEAMPYADQTLGRLPVAAAGLPATFEINEVCDEIELKRSVLYNEYWRPMGVEHNINAFFQGNGVPFAMTVVARSIHERRFTAGQVRLMDQARALAEPVLRSLATLGGDQDMRQLLSILERGMPIAAALFDSAGSLQWLSEECRLHLEILAMRVGEGLFLQRCEALDQMRRIATTIAERPQDMALDWFLPCTGEHLLVRRIESPSGAHVLLAIEPSWNGIGVVPDSPSQVAGLGLTARELDIATLASEGFSVLNMATRLGISESTVRTHLRRIYSRLRVGSRVELAHALTRGRTRTNSGRARR